jgi:protein-S-isoprenylcysteine O-methyltransferase Ste14
MNEELLFKQLFVAIYAIFLLIRLPIRVKSARKEPELRHELDNWASRTLIVAILGYFGSIALYLLDSPWISWAGFEISIWIRWLGVIGASCSVVLVAWTHRELGRQYAAEIAVQEEHTLVTTGPYARTRHPMYTALNAFSFSMALMTSNLLVLFFAIFVMVPFPSIAKDEEQVLLETFGEEYREYMKRTGRFFPRIQNRSNNKEYKVHI